MGPRLGFTLVFIGWLLWQGYQRRRGVWTRRSWRRFGALMGAAVGAFLLAMAMALGVDRGVYVGMAPLAARLYGSTLLALVVGSPLAVVCLAWWFGRGRPERQLG
jgi:hypothetical protein